jgi:HK97 family phage portal protein
VSRLTDVLFGKRDNMPAPRSLIGFSADGGLLPGGVSGTTALGISAVWRSLDILANGVSQLPWHERRGNLDLPLSRLVVRPQVARTRREWTSIVVSTLALYDVCYLLKAGGEDSEGVPLSLVYLQPPVVMPVITDYWNVYPPTEYYVFGVKVPAEELVVLHRSPQPGVYDTMGGVIQMARATFAAAIGAENYASRYWQAGGSPAGYLKTDANLNQPQSDDLTERWREKRARGPDYPPVMTNGIEYKETGADPTSISAVEARKEMVADIGRYFGIPTHTLNAPAGDSETYSSTEAGNQDLVRYTLQNYIGAIEDGISDQLPHGRRMRMDPQQLLDGTWYSRMQGFQLATSGKAWMLPQEVRDRLGLPPLEDPDELNPRTTSRSSGRTPPR